MSAGRVTGSPADAYPTFCHPDDSAVDRFAEAMKVKMAAARTKGRGGWDNEAICQVERLQGMLLDHVGKGDPVDVGNFAMMLFNRGERTAAPVPASEAAKQTDQAHVMPPFAAPASQLDASNVTGDWQVRERRCAANGDLIDCFIEAPPEGGMAYGLEVLGDDYNGFGDVERKLEHCKLIVALVNEAAKREQSGIAGSAKGGITNDSITTLATPAAPTDAKPDELGDPDMLWDAEDAENCYGDGPEDFANNYASNCLSPGEDIEVDVLCVYRGSTRTMRIALAKNDHDEELENPVSWSWIDSANSAAPQPSTTP